eukprot:1146967-Pelagomonas_calceolata.AAC.2
MPSDGMGPKLAIAALFDSWPAQSSPFDPRQLCSPVPVLVHRDARVPADENGLDGALIQPVLTGQHEHLATCHHCDNAQQHTNPDINIIVMHYNVTQHHYGNTQQHTNPDINIITMHYNVTPHYCNKAH